MSLAASLLLLMGAFFIFLSALGLWRMPDLYCRSHSLAKSMPLGINLMLIAAWMSLDHDQIGFKTFLAIVFQLVSIPVAGHLLAYHSFKSGVPRWQQRDVEEDS